MTEAPRYPGDPCWDWKQFRLERIARQMREGNYGIPQPRFTDQQKVAIARELQRRYSVTVWLDQGSLRYRDGLQGERFRLAWRDAGILTEYLPIPRFRKLPESVKRFRSKRRAA